MMSQKEAPWNPQGLAMGLLGGTIVNDRGFLCNLFTTGGPRITPILANQKYRVN